MSETNELQPCPCGGPDCEGDNLSHHCGGPREACGVPGCLECRTPSPETEQLRTRVAELEAALALLPDEINMVEHNPDEGPLMFCCGRKVTIRGLHGLLITHDEECWYAQMRAMRARVTELERERDEAREALDEREGDMHLRIRARGES